jgi:hypothetical protein
MDGQVGEKEKWKQWPLLLSGKKATLFIFVHTLSLSLVVVGQSPLSELECLLLGGGWRGDEGDPEGIVTGKDDIVAANIYFSHIISNHHHSFSLFLFYSTLTATITNNIYTGSKISSKREYQNVGQRIYPS